MRRYLATLTAGLLCAGPVCAGGQAATAAVLGTAPVTTASSSGWGKASAVPGLAALTVKGGAATLNSLSCASPGNCSAGGYYQYSLQCCEHNLQAFVVSQVNGVWNKALTVPGIAALNKGGDSQIVTISCVAPGNCAAGGFYATGQSGGGATLSSAFVIDEVNGAWGTAQPVTGLPARYLDSGVGTISCARLTKSGRQRKPYNCSAGGSYDYTTRSGERSTGFVLTEVAGRWGDASPVARTTGIAAVSCASAGNCSAVGNYYLLSQVNGVWRKAVQAKSSFGTVNIGLGMVSCAAPGDCAAAGQADSRALVLSQTNGTWGRAQRIAGVARLEPGGASALSSISCASPGNCTAGGYGDYSTEVGSSTREYAAAFLAIEKNGRWGRMFAVPGLAALNKFRYAVITSVSCSSARNCATGGAFGTSDYMPEIGAGPSDAFVANEVQGTWHAARDVTTTLGSQGPAQITTVSCPAVSKCSAIGSYWIGFQQQLAFVISQVR